MEEIVGINKMATSPQIQSQLQGSNLSVLLDAYVAGITKRNHIAHFLAKLSYMYYSRLVHLLLLNRLAIA